ncbi:cobaltochelatase CobT-related protein [Amycolatopsis anabasis]|uniref:cobaltochelatase CobT-related protein n=1 Tax=Amycolatopsis anabasis TaxID=1840409 RepID=UPI00131BCCCB|nr:cobalt chelatase [Amycolatopsis anabasis]
MVQDALADRAAARATHRLDLLRGATVRAIGQDPRVRFRAGEPYRGATRLTMLAPHLRVDAEADPRCWRGAADGLALRMRHTDPALHREHRPAGDIGGLLFDQLEQFRVESLVPQWFPGTTANLRHRMEHWLVAADGDGLTDTAAGLLLHAVAAMAWSHLTGFPVPAPVDEVIEPTRAALAPEFGPRITRLGRLRAEPERFTPLAAEFAVGVANLLGAPSGKPRLARSAGQRALTDLLRGSGPEDAGVPVATGGRRESEVDEYRIFTTAHDRQRDATDLVRPAQQKEFRQRLDDLGRRARLNRAKMLRDLAAALLVPATDGWEHGLDSGHLDGRRLATLITSPAETRVFRAEATTRKADVSVTFLLDCSGSMKQHVPLTAVLVDNLTRVLDELGVTTEVLGFSTEGWNGGRARRDWARAGRPADPGRLNDRLHLVFKNAASSWRRSRRGVAGLFKTDLFREGLGGEAVRWAAARSRGFGARRGILVLFSDGSPADSATAAVNPDGFLEHDLLRGVHEAETGGTEVYALSLGVDLGHLFPRSLVLPARDQADQRMIDEIIETLGPA